MSPATGSSKDVKIQHQQPELVASQIHEIAAAEPGIAAASSDQDPDDKEDGEEAEAPPNQITELSEQIQEALDKLEDKSRLVETSVKTVKKLESEITELKYQFQMFAVAVLLLQLLQMWRR